jgi:hypothetical protein
MGAASSQQNRASLVSVSLWKYLTAACSCLVLLLIAPSANPSPLALQPGETAANIAASGQVIESSNPISHPIGSVIPIPGTAVAFNRADPQTQNMFLFVKSIALTQTARGMLYADFCVPKPGLGACDTAPDPNAPDIIVSLTFQYGVIGTAFTGYFLADASLALTGSVVDTVTNSFVAFQDLIGNNLSSHGVQFSPISIDWVPVPLPNYSTATIKAPITFPAMLLKRGRIYRFQLSAAATAKGILPNAPPSYVDAWSNDKRIMLTDLTINVNQDSSIGNLQEQVNSLQAAVSALQTQLGSLAARIDALQVNLQASIDALSAAIAAQHNGNRSHQNEYENGGNLDESGER